MSGALSIPSTESTFGTFNLYSHIAISAMDNMIILLFVENDVKKPTDISTQIEIRSLSNKLRATISNNKYRRNLSCKALLPIFFKIH